MIRTCLPRYALLGALLTALVLPLTSQAAWTQVALDGVENRPQDITFYNNMFIAAGYGGEIYTSPDGMSWTTIILPVNESQGYIPGFRGLAASDNLVVAVGDLGLIATSANGTDWTIVQQPSESLDGFQAVSFGGSNFAAVTYGNEVYTSSDGVTWVPNAAAWESTNLTAITYTGDVFVALPQSGNEAYTSEGGTSWSLLYNQNLSPFGYITRARAVNDAVYATGALYSNGNYAPGLAYAVDENGFTFANFSGSVSEGGLNDIAEGPDGQLVAIGSYYIQASESYAASMYSSSDGMTFSAVDNNLSSSANAIIYAKGLWVVMEDGYAAYTDSISGGDTPTTPYLVQGATDFGGGWYGTWLGDVNVNGWPWVYTGIGWFYAGNAGNTNASGWYFMTASQLNCWLYTGDGTFPWVYGQPTGKSEGWWYVDTNQDGFTYFFMGSEFVAVPDEF